MTSVTSDKPIILIALGGNALIKKGQRGTIEEQFENLKIPLRQVARLSREYRIILTHGNGPQVGDLLLRQECCDQVPNAPLEILVAQTEGQIGFMIESTLDEELMALGVDFRPIVSLITYVVVNRNDPAFSNPSKPIGPIYTREESKKLSYPVIRTAKGFRRVVASPKPLTVIEKREIKILIEKDFIVICCGGGGIPVVRNDRSFAGVDAVIDKDLASLCLAKEVGVDIFLIATDTDGVMLNYGTDRQTLLRRVSVTEAETYISQGHFRQGSMLPKVEAVTGFVKNGGKRAIITSSLNIESALSGRAGTHFFR